jgi:ATP-dependent DNA helicase PIF1
MNSKQPALSREQEIILKLVESKYSLFLTGQRGCGKSYLIKKIVEKESARGGCFVTASTGIAAVNISGTTTHAFAGIKIWNKICTRALRLCYIE